MYNFVDVREKKRLYCGIKAPFLKFDSVINLLVMLIQKGEELSKGL